MNRLVRTGVLMVALALAVVPAHAGVCDNDNNPAATLLLPYFEVDTVRADGANTVFSISNAFETAHLAHITLWSDLSVPVLDFNVYLTGFDQVTVNLRDIIVNGVLPQTASDGQDPADVISPQGQFSQDINFASCTGQLPLPPLPPIFLTHLQNSLTGRPSPIFGNQCAGQRLGDKVARGYVTIDTVNNCTLRFAYDPGYFGPGGDATNDNVLFGDYTLIGRQNRSQATQPLVAIQADGTAPETTTPGNYTFYGRYVGWNASDNREPLPTTFGARYVNAQTDLLVWRDSKTNVGTFACNTTPAPFPLGLESAILFDDQENPLELLTSPLSPTPSNLLTALGAEAQRVAVGSGALATPASQGWAYLNLNTTVTGNPNPSSDPAAAQAWVTIISKDATGRYTSGYDAMHYDSACSAKHSNPGN